MWKSRGFRWGMGLLLVLGLGYLGLRYSKRINWNASRSIGQPMDSLDGVAVYYNGGVDQSHGRNTSPDGYNIGIRYQCVEFVKRYYLEVYHHKMPDAYGHAKDFFDPTVPDGALNHARGLKQFKHHGCCRPGHGDLLVWGPSLWNPYGHVAIADEWRERPGDLQMELSYLQQNPGPFGDARGYLPFSEDQQFHDDRLLGWLSMPD